MIPLFLVVSTIHHTFDVQIFLPETQTTTTVPVLPGAEILEEISFEDEIHSLLLIFNMPEFLLSTFDFLFTEINVLNKIVPTPPPDFS